MNTREVKRQYRLQQWTTLIHECRNSGQTIATWCSENSIKISSYYYWLKKIREAACESLSQTNNEHHMIVPVNIEPERKDITPASPTNNDCPYTLRINIDNISIEVSNDASSTIIENTLKVLVYVR